MTGRRLPAYHHALARAAGRAPRRRRRRDALALVDLDEQAGRRAVKRYSRGMLQRLGLAQALLGSAALRVPRRAGLGRRSRPASCCSAASSPISRARGVTVVLNSHQLEQVERVCDRVAFVQRRPRRGDRDARTPARRRRACCACAGRRARPRAPTSLRTRLSGSWRRDAGADAAQRAAARGALHRARRRGRRAPAARAGRAPASRWSRRRPRRAGSSACSSSRARARRRLRRRGGAVVNRDADRRVLAAAHDERDSGWRCSAADARAARCWIAVQPGLGLAALEDRSRSSS